VNASHVRPISHHDDDAPPPSDENAQIDDDNQEDLVRTAAALREVQERTVAKTARLVQRMSERPPALAAGRR